MFCGTKHVIKEEIVNNTTINNYGPSAKNVNELVADGEALLNLKQAEKAHAKFKYAVDTAPTDFRAWFGYARALALHRTEPNQTFETAYKLANEEEKKILIDEWINDMERKNDDCLRTSYELLGRVCGDDVKERTRMMWIEQVKRYIAERKKLVYTVGDPNSVGHTDSDLMVKILASSTIRVDQSYFFGTDNSPYAVVYNNTYCSFKIWMAADSLDDDEKKYMVSELKREEARLEKERNDANEKLITSSGVKVNKHSLEMYRRMQSNNPNSLYALHSRALAEIKAFLGKFDTPASSAGEAAQKKKGLWKR
jgi:tetratricopeptide (TPR) repeat protein